MAKFKNVKQGFLMRNAIRFWSNIIKNYDKDIHNSEFFDLIYYCLDRHVAIRFIKGFFSKKELDELSNPDSYKHCDFKTESIGEILEKIWNAEGFRKKAQALLLEMAEIMAESYNTPKKKEVDQVEMRFNKLAAFLKLSRLEADILLFAYIRYATVLNEMPMSFRIGEHRMGYAMAIDCSYDEIVQVMGKEGKLSKYGCLDSSESFNADELGGYLSGNDKRSLEEHFYLETKSETLPWNFFGKLASNEGEMLKNLLKANDSRKLNILLYGAAGTGKTSFAKTLLAELGMSAYEIPLFSKNDSKGKSVENRLACIRVCNDNVCGQKGAIIVDEADAILRTSATGFSFFGDSRTSTEKGMVNSLLDELTMPVIWISNITASEMAESVRRRFDYAISFKTLSRTQREIIWKNNIKRLKLGNIINESLVSNCAARYETSAGGITMVLESVAKLKPIKGVVSELIEKLMRPHCELMFKRIDDGRSEPTKDYQLDGLNIKGGFSLNEMVEATRNFLAMPEKGIDYPRMNILLWGPPGTGKTEFVKYLAHELGLKYNIKMGGDLLSKWVGGTEENIKAAFEEAEYDGSILFFDEIDGLLRDRGGADHSWEVTQVNELLYRMENFKGIFIGATNYNDALDAAVLRRFTFKVEFDVLDEIGKVKFFERTFLTELSNDERSALQEIENLTPGDFRTVRQRLFYLGSKVNNEMRIKALSDECVNKRVLRPRKVGF